MSGNIPSVPGANTFLYLLHRDIENTMKQCAKQLDYQQTPPYEKMILCELPCKPCEVVGVDIFYINNNKLLIYSKSGEMIDLEHSRLDGFQDQGTSC